MAGRGRRVRGPASMVNAVEIHAGEPPRCDADDGIDPSNGDAPADHPDRRRSLATQIVPEPQPRSASSCSAALKKRPIWGAPEQAEETRGGERPGTRRFGAVPNSGLPPGE